MKRSDEHYIIDLCDELLAIRASRQHRFDFLRSDPDKDGVCRRLPVDAYYRAFNLVIQYRECQRFEGVPLFDNRMTVSGVTRREQRAIYDQRRRDVLPEFGIRLVELCHTEFPCTRRRLLRQREHDIEVIKGRLARWL